MWSKLPVPRGPWDWDDCIGGMSFEPNCDEDKYNYECAGAFDKPKVEGTMTCICSGRDLPGLEIVDRVLIPADLPAGEWVLGEQDSPPRLAMVLLTSLSLSLSFLRLAMGLRAVHPGAYALSKEGPGASADLLVRGRPAADEGVGFVL
jgi:hypothetical protein